MLNDLTPPAERDVAVTRGFEKVSPYLATVKFGEGYYPLPLLLQTQDAREAQSQGRPVPTAKEAQAMLDSALQDLGMTKSELKGKLLEHHIYMDSVPLKKVDGQIHIPPSKAFDAARRGVADIAEMGLEVLDIYVPDIAFIFVEAEENLSLDTQLVVKISEDEADIYTVNVDSKKALSNFYLDTERQLFPERYRDFYVNKESAIGAVVMNDVEFSLEPTPNNMKVMTLRDGVLYDIDRDTFQSLLQNELKSPSNLDVKSVADNWLQFLDVAEETPRVRDQLYRGAFDLRRGDRRGIENLLNLAKHTNETLYGEPKNHDVFINRLEDMLVVKDAILSQPEILTKEQIAAIKEIPAQIASKRDLSPTEYRSTNTFKPADFKPWKAIGVLGEMQNPEGALKLLQADYKAHNTFLKDEEIPGYYNAVVGVHFTYDDMPMLEGFIDDYMKDMQEDLYRGEDSLVKHAIGAAVADAYLFYGSNSLVNQQRARELVDLLVNKSDTIDANPHANLLVSKYNEKFQTSGYERLKNDRLTESFHKYAIANAIKELSSHDPEKALEEDTVKTMSGILGSPDNLRYFSEYDQLVDEVLKFSNGHAVIYDALMKSRDRDHYNIIFSKQFDSIHRNNPELREDMYYYAKFLQNGRDLVESEKRHEKETYELLDYSSVASPYTTQKIRNAWGVSDISQWPAFDKQDLRLPQEPSVAEYHSNPNAFNEYERQLGEDVYVATGIKPFTPIYTDTPEAQQKVFNVFGERNQMLTNSPLGPIPLELAPQCVIDYVLENNMVKKGMYAVTLENYDNLEAMAHMNPGNRVSETQLKPMADKILNHGAQLAEHEALRQEESRVTRSVKGPQMHH